MNERTQFYINEEAKFGRMDPAVRHLHVRQRAEAPGIFRSLFRGISFGFMLAIYTIIACVILDRLEAPLPYAVKNIIAETEYKVSNFIYEIRYSDTGWKFFSSQNEVVVNMTGIPSEETASSLTAPETAAPDTTAPETSE